MTYLLNQLKKKLLSDNIKNLSLDYLTLISESNKPTIISKVVDTLQQHNLLNYPLSADEHNLVKGRNPPRYLKILILHNWKPTGMDILVDWESFSEEKKIFHYINNIHEIPLCRMCTNKVRWTTSKGGSRYTLHCSNQCRALDPDVRNKQEQTSIQRYGEIKVFSNTNHLQKTRDTYKLQHGVAFPLQNKQHLENTRRIIEEKYGEPYLNVIHKRAKDQFTQDHGDQSFGQVFSHKHFREKSNKTKRDAWLPKRLELFRDKVIPLFDTKDYVNKFQRLPYKCIQCATEFESNFVIKPKSHANEHIPRCPNCFPLNNTNWTQHELSNFCKSHSTDVVINTRKVIAPLELDVYFPEHQLAIEFDGLYWHSDVGSNHRIDNQYHINKTNLCTEKNIQLLHIFEDEWYNKQDIVKSIILSKLHKTQTLHGRKCRIVALTSHEARHFCDLNHIQGSDNSSIRYGLMHKDELVSVMTFGKARFNKRYQYELMRFCNKLNTSVVGGASKLLKHFIKIHDPTSIITYADRRYSTGNLYDQLGFTRDGETQPSYFYVNISEGCLARHSRLQFQKHKLKDKLSTFNSELSESDNMYANGYGKIYDCGSLRYVMVK